MSQGSLFKGILLVAGTSIGGGMLALPVLTSQTGFLPAICIYFLCWAFMAGTGLLFLETCLWMKPNTNIISMSEYTLGKPGKWAAWFLYLFLFYCLTLAYIVGCGNLVVSLFQHQIPEWLGALIFIALFSPIVFAGASLASRINIPLMAGLAVSYFVFVFLGYTHIQPELLTRENWAVAPMALPIAFTAFSYQGIVPTLVGYLDRHPQRIRTAILIGSFIPFVVYVIWQALILGIIPLNAPGGLQDAMSTGSNAVDPLRFFLKSPYIYILGQSLAFFALVTSFLGVTLGLMDFLSDGLNIKQTRSGKLLLSLIVFVPPLIVAITYPGMFLQALDYAGGYGCALLLGLLPVLMVWSGRYRLNLASEYRLKGGKWLLTAFLFFVAAELLCQSLF